MTVPQDVAELAAAHRVSTSYSSWTGEAIEVDESVVRAVLTQLGAPAMTDDDLAVSLARVRSRTLPDTIALREGATLGAELTVTLEDGTAAPPGSVLPVGYHRASDGEHTATVIVAPAQLGEVPRCWGWQVQLYALHSEHSWGAGDYRDLAEFCRRAAIEQGAGVVLVNPVNAVTPIPPFERSPYSPASRRRVSPFYLCITDLPEFANAPDELRRKVLELAPAAVQPHGLIDHDKVWSAKLAALELLWPLAPDDVGVDDGVLGFGTFCALAELRGADWRTWPEPLRDSRSGDVKAASSELADRVGFHAWMQLRAEQQLRAAHDAARAMRIGIVHDLPVGTSASGADTWLEPELFAPSVRVGCPPDAFQAAGQDWGMPPWRPQRLAELGYAPFRDVVQSILGHSDGIRVDHVAGLWRLWWVPPGEPATRGTYVHYDAQAMLGVLAIEAHRSGAVVVGEDLGTIEPEVRSGLFERGMLGSAVLMFQHDWDAPGKPFLIPERWEPHTMASITTHDLPTALGWLSAGRTRDTEAIVDLLHREGIDSADPVLGMHELIARAASRLVLTSPYDAVGETRQPNLPGTVEEHPNWQIPVQLTMAEFFDNARVAELIEPLRRARS